MLGTPKYISPEQCDGREGLSGKADVYSLGIIMYEMLAGAAPFHARAGMAYMRQHMMAEPPSLRERAPHVSKELHDLIHSMLAKEPPARPAMTQVVEVLRQMQDVARSLPFLMPVTPPPARQRSVLWIGGAGLVLILVLGLTGVVWLRRPPSGPGPLPSVGSARDGGAAGPADLVVAPLARLADLGTARSVAATGRSAGKAPPPDAAAALDLAESADLAESRGGQAVDAGASAEPDPEPDEPAPPPDNDKSPSGKSGASKAEPRHHGGKHGGKHGKAHAAHAAGGRSSHGKHKE